MHLLEEMTTTANKAMGDQDHQVGKGKIVVLCGNATSAGMNLEEEFYQQGSTGAGVHAGRLCVMIAQGFCSSRQTNILRELFAQFAGKYSEVKKQEGEFAFIPKPRHPGIGRVLVPYVVMEPETIQSLSIQHPQEPPEERAAVGAWRIQLTFGLHNKRMKWAG